MRMAKNPRKQRVSDSEFHAALQNMTQFLYIIRDMASSDDERNQKNAPSQPDLESKLESKITSKLQNYMMTQLDNSEVFS